MAKESYDRMVFCDFDRTITAEETFSGMLMTLAPALADQVLNDMYKKRITLREGIRLLLESMGSDRLGEIKEYVRGKEIRPGFVDLLDFLDGLEVPFVVVSGGLRVMIEEVLGPLLDRLAGVFALDLDSSGERLRVVTDYESETELLAKARVMELYNPREAVAIGDGITDINMAVAADVVFARDSLTRYLDRKGVPYLPWNDFLDIKTHLECRWRL